MSLLRTALVLNESLGWINNFFFYYNLRLCHSLFSGSKRIVQKSDAVLSDRPGKVIHELRVDMKGGEGLTVLAS